MPSEVWAGSDRHHEELGLLIRLLDPEDYKYIRAYDFRVERRFRQRRMTVYRGGLAMRRPRCGSIPTMRGSAQ